MVNFLTSPNYTFFEGGHVVKVQTGRSTGQDGKVRQWHVTSGKALEEHMGLVGVGDDFGPKAGNYHQFCVFFGWYIPS